MEDQKGIASVLILIIGLSLLALIAYIFFSSTKRIEKNSSSNNSINTALDRYSYSDLQLENLGVRFGSYDKAAGMSGDFEFSNEAVNNLKLIENRVFVEFGYVVEGRDGRKILPEYTWQVPEDTDVIAPTDGYISKIGIIDWSQDYSVSIKNDTQSPWMVTLEHVQHLEVEEGDKVNAGQKIGKVSTVDFEGTGYGFSEISVWRGGGTEKDIVKVCPYLALTSQAKEDLSVQITGFISNWEDFIGEDVYDEESWVHPGCLYEQLTEHQVFNPDEYGLLD